MRWQRMWFIGAAIVVGAAFTGSPVLAQSPPEEAVAVLVKADGTRAGSVELSAFFEDTEVQVRVRGLPPGFHGVHVHTTGSCQAPSFTSAGGHLNPAGATHPNHAGDMPVVHVNRDGTSYALHLTDRFRLDQLFDADGSAIVVHALPDNYVNIPTDRYDPDPDATTLATGDAGERIACGVVRQGFVGGPSVPEEYFFPTATAELRGPDGLPSGSVAFYPGRSKVLVHANLFREPAAGAFHGFHIHATGSCEAPSFVSAGGHHNPAGASHAGHAGDLPTVYTKPAPRVGGVVFEIDRFRVGDLFDADGSAIVLHADPDNFANIPTDRYDPDVDATTLSTGDAGARIACGIVRRVVRCVLTVRPRTLRAGRRAVVRISARSDGRPLEESVEIVGAGIVPRTRETGREGTARVAVRPTRPGRITLRISRSDRTLGCTRRIRVVAGVGAALTGRRT